MEIIDNPRKCIHFDTSATPVIESIRLTKENRSKGMLYLYTNEVLFIMEGRVRFIFNDFPGYDAVKGQMLFFPAGGSYSYYGLSHATLLIFRLRGPVRLCDAISLEKLHKSRQEVEAYEPYAPNFCKLEVHTHIRAFLNGINNCLADGVKCRIYFDLKIKEFFFLLRFYYGKKEIYDFLCLILSSDTAFSEYVRQNWHRYRTVNEIAAAMHRTPRQFSVKFKQVFGVSPYKWMKEGKAEMILQQLQKTNKPIKQVAIENGFGTAPQFSKFCKNEFGKTPTELRTTCNSW